MLPDTFQSELTARLGPNYFLVRSLEQPRWRIEQKVSRAYDYPANSDRARMLKEGRHLVLDSPDSDTTRCPHCHALLALPVFVKMEFYCEACQARGYKVRIVDGYFPLVDKTLLYLERTSPRRGFAWSKEIDQANADLMKGMYRDTRNVAEALAKDAWNRVSGALQFGRTKAGTPHAYGAD